MRGLRTNDQWIAFKKRLGADRLKRAVEGESETVPVTEILTFSEVFWKRYAQLDSEQHSESIPRERPGDEVAGLTLESAEAVAMFEVSGVVAEISPRPALFVQGEDDDVVAVEDVLRVFRKAGQPKHFISLPGCDHIDLDHGPGFERQVALSLEWFKKYL
jgi:pimeloyl-ACP methyl ester carboxylesterase